MRKSRAKILKMVKMQRSRQRTTIPTTLEKHNTSGCSEEMSKHQIQQRILRHQSSSQDNDSSFKKEDFPPQYVFKQKIHQRKKPIVEKLNTDNVIGSTLEDILQGHILTDSSQSRSSSIDNTRETNLILEKHIKNQIIPGGVKNTITLKHPSRSLKKNILMDKIQRNKYEYLGIMHQRSQMSDCIKSGNIP